MTDRNHEDDPTIRVDRSPPNSLTLYVLDDDAKPTSTWVDNGGRVTIITDGPYVVWLRRRADAPDAAPEGTA